MASTFKTFVSDDIANTRTLLHEAIPITGSIVNGATYTDAQSGEEKNIKTYGHGMFQSVYDYPYASSSANHIFDLAYGTSATIQRTENANEQVSNVADTNPSKSKRLNIYNQMGQVLVGHDVSGNIRKFDTDGDLTGGATHDNAFFINFARLLGKDEIKKGTFSMEVGTTEEIGAVRFDNTCIISDDGAESDYRVNSPAGEYGILKLTNGTNGNVQPNFVGGANNNCGLIFYQAGIVVLNPLIWALGNSGANYNPDALGSEEEGNDTGEDELGHDPGFLTNGVKWLSDGTGLVTSLNGDNVSNDEILNGLRARIKNIQFSNTTELNSTIYFCRVGHNDFNYSSNPTYLENSKIKVKNKTTDAPVSYITTVGLYSADNEMLAVAKLSEPLRKDPTNDITLRVRLDY